jgi:hypothetical protein
MDQCSSFFPTHVTIGISRIQSCFCHQASCCVYHSTVRRSPSSKSTAGDQPRSVTAGRHAPSSARYHARESHTNARAKKGGVRAKKSLDTFRDGTTTKSAITCGTAIRVATIVL